MFSGKTPDIAFAHARIAVFVDGCFWHACPEHGVLPKSNREWWRDKLERNVGRDRDKDRALTQLGWVLMHVWEQEDTHKAVAVIGDVWRNRTGRQ